MHLGTLVNLLSHVTFIVLFMHLLFLNCICPSVESRTLRGPRALSYIANQTVCMVDKIIYKDGDPIPTDDPCESCKCRPPGFSCVLRECEVKPGCKAIRREGECCPEYQCGCEHNGKFFNDGDRIPYAESPCYTCYCQGSSITCALADCKFRFDCEPEYITGECCPRYDHCPPEPTAASPLTTNSTTYLTTPIPITTASPLITPSNTLTTDAINTIDSGNSSSVTAINQPMINETATETITPPNLLPSVTTENVINESSSNFNNTLNSGNNSSNSGDIGLGEVFVSKEQVDSNLPTTSSGNNNKGESTYLTTPTTTPPSSSSSSSATSTSSTSTSTTSNVQEERVEGVKNVLTLPSNSNSSEQNDTNGNSLQQVVPSSSTSTTESLKVTTTNLTFQTLEINDSSSSSHSIDPVTAATVASTSTLAHEEQITGHQQVANKNSPAVAVDEEASTSTNYPKEVTTTIESIPGPIVETATPMAIVTGENSPPLVVAPFQPGILDESINELKITTANGTSAGHVITQSNNSPPSQVPWSPSSSVLSPETSDETTTLPSPVVVKVKELVKGQSQASDLAEMAITMSTPSSSSSSSSFNLLTGGGEEASSSSLFVSTSSPVVTVVTENSQPTIWSKDVTTFSNPNSQLSSLNSSLPPTASSTESVNVPSSSSSSFSSSSFSSSSSSSSPVFDSNSDADVSTDVTTQLSSIHPISKINITDSQSSNILTNNSNPEVKLETATVVNVNLVSDEVTTDYPTTKTWIPDTSLIKEHREASTVNSQPEGPVTVSSQSPFTSSSSFSSPAVTTTTSTISLAVDADIESIKLITTTISSADSSASINFESTSASIEVTSPKNSDDEVNKILTDSSSSSSSSTLTSSTITTPTATSDLVSITTASPSAFFNLI